jgi:hypothetical protein
MNKEVDHLVGFKGVVKQMGPADKGINVGGINNPTKQTDTLFTP